MSSIFYTFILFSNCLEKYLPFLSYMDELLMLTFFLLAVVKIIMLRDGVNDLLNPYDYWLMVLLAGLLITGLLSNLIAWRALSAVGIIKDVILVSKFFLCFLCGKILFVNIDRKKIMNNIRGITKVSIAVVFICGVLSLFVDIGMGQQIRFGIRSYQFLYTHYTFLVYAEVIMCAVICEKEERGNSAYLMMALGTLLMTLRTKAVMFCIVVLVFRMIDRFGYKIKLRDYVLVGGAGLAAAWGKITEYLSYGSSYNMRNGLYAAGAELAKQYFPFGSGFCTFGSNISYIYTKQMYSELDLLSHQGFDVGKPVISDVFWPYVYGQFGVIGMALYLGMLLMIFKSMKWELNDTDGKMFQGANLILAYLLVASVAEAVFTNASGVYSAVILAVYFRRKNEVEYNNTIRMPYMIRF